jgi:ATP:ADP antiporter, AAA family
VDSKDKAASPGAAESAIFLRLLRKIVDVKADEVRALGLGFLYYFLIFSSYYVIRPIRDDIGAANGVEKLPWLFTGTLVAMLIANTLFAALVVKFSRRRFIPITYRVLIANLVIFFVLLLTISKDHQVWVGRVFFVWTSVFNLFVVSVFWAFMVDVFNTDQGKRLFGFISVGGTLGAIVGAAITAGLVQKIGSLNLLLVSAVLLELGAQCVRLFPTTFNDAGSAPRQKAFEESPVGGRIWTGITHSIRSPYLLGICAYMFFYASTSTFLYFQQIGIAEHAFSDSSVRTAFFAEIDLIVNVLTILAQLFLAARLLQWLGVGVTLAILPALSLIGFAAMGAAPTLSLLVVFLVLRRAANFAIARPARETLFTVISKEDKYKAKNLIDTFVYRTADQVAAWSSPITGWLGLGLVGVSVIAAPIAAIWFFVSLWLGRKQVRIAELKDRER